VRNAPGFAFAQHAEEVRVVERLAVRLLRPLPVAAPPPRILSRICSSARPPTVRGYLQALDPDPMLIPGGVAD